MDTKTIKKIRKYYDYKFSKDGILYMRRKVDGNLSMYDSIENFLSCWISTNIGIGTSMKWGKHKRNIRNNKIWKNINK